MYNVGLTPMLPQCFHASGLTPMLPDPNASMLRETAIAGAKKKWGQTHIIHLIIYTLS